jgi:Tfp pilus assembly protein PilN
MRPVNLIPAEQRRGSARVGSSRRKPIGPYFFLGALAAGVLCVLALVLTGNDVKSKQGQLADLQTKEQGAKAVADALRPYGDFASVQKGRQQQIEQVAANRFDWDHALEQLARTTPRNVWLLTVSGTVGPGVQVDTAGGDVGSLREDIDAPAFAMTGCTFSQRAVARMMVRMRNLDGVTDVKFSKAEKHDDAGGGGAPAPATSAAAGGATDAQGDCVGSSRVTKFDILVAFGGAKVATTTTPDAGGAASSTQATLAKANAAATQAQPSGATTTPAAGGGK